MTLPVKGVRSRCWRRTSSSGQTLGVLQKVRSDVEKLIVVGISRLFTTLVGVVFVTIYAFSVHWVIAPRPPRWRGPRPSR